MKRQVIVACVVGALLASGMALGQSAQPSGAQPMVPSCGTKPPDGPCYTWVCDGGWQKVYKAAGTACNDGQACTYNDKCNSTGVCAGTQVSPPCVGSNPCEVKSCNGTATCSVAPAAAGTVCRPAAASNPCDKAEACSGSSTSCPADGASGWNAGAVCSDIPGCTCTSSGACQSSQTRAGYCYDVHGNLTLKWSTVAGQTCPSTQACP